MTDSNRKDGYELRALSIATNKSCDCHEQRNSLLDVTTETKCQDAHDVSSAVGSTTDCVLLVTVHTVTNIFNYADRYLVAGKLV